MITPFARAGEISSEEFARRFPSLVDEGKLAPCLLDDACAARNADDLFCAMLIGFRFGFSVKSKDTLCCLVDGDWHFSHEDVVAALQTWPTPDTVEALFRATQWIPKSLEYDDARALAVRAIWALGKIPGVEAKTKLEILALSEDARLRNGAIEQLARRGEPLPVDNHE